MADISRNVLVVDDDQDMRTLLRDVLEERGRQDGHALRDWLDAEAQVMEPCHATRQ